MKIAIIGPGLTVSTDAPVESADALQRSALEVSMPPPTPAEERRVGLELAAWLREQRAKQAG